MGLSAPTAPKGKGQDLILIKVVVGEELQELSRELSRLGLARSTKFYLRDAKNLEQSDACVLMAARSGDNAGLNCRRYGFSRCQDMIAAQNRSIESQERVVAYGIPLKASGKNIYFGRQA